MISFQRIDQSGWVDVVVVDARPADYVEMAARLVADPMSFRFARTACDALRMARHPGPRAVWLINVSLPDMTGAELLSLLRERDPEVVSFLVGEAYQAEEERQTRQCGAVAYVCKPAISEWLAPWRTRRSQPAQPSPRKIGAR